MILGEIISICSADKEVKGIILYGSRAKGTYLQKSDIDIALIGNNINLDKLKNQIDEIETLLGIDLIDLNNCKNNLLIKEVLKDGITIYSTL